MKSFIDPKELAKRSKESSRTVSLRVKERTWLGFEQLAKENDTTANALISELADYYIENLNGKLNLSDAAVEHNRFKNALGKEIKRMCHLTIDDVISEYCPFPTEYYRVNDKYTLLEFSKKSITKFSNGEVDIMGRVHDELLFGNFYDGKIVLCPSLKKKEAVYCAGSYSYSSGVQDVLYIPFEKSPDVIHILEFAEQNSKGNLFKGDPDVEIMDKIAEIINSYDYHYTENGINAKYDEEERKSMLNEIALALTEWMEEKWL
ncbi:hypothetical protein IJG89_00695 [Candidatus Saccharibacteria bacterium]|nr:hypothetical protein [Candidatus Saccharibacteria bacterium]